MTGSAQVKRDACACLVRGFFPIVPRLYGRLRLCVNVDVTNLKGTSCGGLGVASMLFARDWTSSIRLERLLDSQSGPKCMEATGGPDVTISISSEKRPLFGIVSSEMRCLHRFLLLLSSGSDHNGEMGRSGMRWRRPSWSPCPAY